MRESIKQFAALVSRTLPIDEPVYEFGSLQVLGQRGYANLRPFFRGKTFVGCDIVQGPGVDRILDLQNVQMLDESVGTVIAMDTLEHVEFPAKAVEEAYRILKPNGLLMIGSAMNFPIHNYPEDYWRFTPAGFKSLLRPFPFAFVESAGEESFPHTVVGIGCKGKDAQPPPGWTNFLAQIVQWKSTRGWRTEIQKWIPPVALPVALGIWRRVS